MNKCNFCKYSTPTGNTGCWKCDYEHSVLDRIDRCEEALKTMKEYNETRAKGNENKK